jgi:SOUL heme-binding protein
MCRQLLRLLALFSLPLLSACAVFGDIDAKIAPYEITQADGIFELREYDKLIIVSTAKEEGLENTREPFFKLFDYISGKNKKSEKISMTAPVIMGTNSQVGESMSFVLPSEYSLTNAPTPTDPALKISEIGNLSVAVITFDGFLSEENVSIHRALLMDWITKNNLIVVGEPMVAGYNPPYTLPSLRRNEVIMQVE